MITTSSSHPQLKLKYSTFEGLQTVEGLAQLDQHFLDYLSHTNLTLFVMLRDYREGKLTSLDVSEFVIACAPILEKFIAELFGIESAISDLYQKTHEYDPIFEFKNHYIHQAKRLLRTVNDVSQFSELNSWLISEIKVCSSVELSVAKLGLHFLSDKTRYQTEIEKLTHWCALAMQCDAGRVITKNWMSFHQPHKKDYDHLVALEKVPGDIFHRDQAPDNKKRERDGFALTDHRLSLEKVMGEIHYCVYCHENQGDYCSKGFLAKKNQPEMGFKKNPLDETLTGCPLDEKISEMNVVKKNGYGIGALAIVTIDNPMCAITGHRICNDCMKACIYQKQDPVNIPEIETRVLTDVLNLPWGVEIYDLLIRWNPLRQTQYTPQSYNNKKIAVMGMGPAGITISHYLLMEGCAVVGFDGLKIEPLPAELLSQPIYDFNAICESLDNRVMSGFGGVAEYGITVRWDKNFLKLLYINLMRRSHFQLQGNTRFGGTLTVENAWELGFDHVVIAVGAGLPRELKIPNSLAKGMRQANDFLMSLQLNGAVKKDSMSNLQVRLPAIVIGGGLTGVDTATEVQAYYVVQVEKIHQRYHILSVKHGENALRDNFDRESLLILDEYLSHAEKIIQERETAAKENRAPELNKLIREWGGVTIAYRKKIQESPAYLRNHEELNKALEEGIYYAENVNPVSVILDEFGNTAGMTFADQLNQTQTMPVKSIFVATGSKPNIAYEFEHRGTFSRHDDVYQTYNENNEKTVVADNIKSNPIGIFTSYDKNDHRVSFLGDTHPLFHGNVVKAIASAKRAYPDIISAIEKRSPSEIHYSDFKNNISHLFSAVVDEVIHHSATVSELIIHSPMSAMQFHAGQFYRLQNYETQSTYQSEPVAALAIPSENKAHLSFFVINNGASTRLLSQLKKGEPIALMGPTGAKTKLLENESILIVGDALSIPYLLSLQNEIAEKNVRVHFISTAEDPFAMDRIEKIAEKVIFCDPEKIIDVITSSVDRKNISSVFVIGAASILKTIQCARATLFSHNVKFTASVYGSMQCMLKGVCAQCLQWQIDPATGQRTKAVYACSWQHQPMEIVDIDHLQDRMGQNKMQEVLTDLWVNHQLMNQ